MCGPTLTTSRPREFADARALLRRQQFAQRQHAAQPAVGIGGVDRVHRLLATRPRHGPHRHERLLHRERLGHRHELRGHQATGRVRIVLQQPFGFGRRLRRQLGEDLVGGLLVELLEHVGALVGRHLLDDGRRRPRRERFEHLGAELLVEILEHVGGALLGQRREQRARPFRRQQLGHVREVGRMQLLRLRPDALRRLLEQLEQVGSQQGRQRTFRVVRRWRHAEPLPCGASVTPRRPTAAARRAS
jgi:hypothetical protein